MAEFSLSGKDFNKILESILTLDSFFKVKIKGRGYSMSPLIKDHSVVVLKSIGLKSRIRFGDVVAVLTAEKNKIIIHRVIGQKAGRYLTKGDNNHEADGWCSIKDIVGIVDEISGDGYIKKCNPLLNTVLAIGSKTFVLDRLFFPFLRYLRGVLK